MDTSLIYGPRSPQSIACTPCYQPIDVEHLDPSGASHRRHRWSSQAHGSRPDTVGWEISPLSSHGFWSPKLFASNHQQLQQTSTNFNSFKESALVPPREAIPLSVSSFWKKAFRSMEQICTTKSQCRPTLSRPSALRPGAGFRSATAFTMGQKLHLMVPTLLLCFC